MTDAQIDALTGTNLAAAVAERILGRTLDGRYWRWTTEAGEELCQVDWGYRPDRDMGEAWLLAERLRARGFQIQLTTPAEVSRYKAGEFTDPEACCVVEFHWWLPENGQWCHVNAQAGPDEAPTAVCRAALKVVREATL